MSNQTEIERLETARDRIRTALINFGIADESAKLDALAKKIAAIRVQEATTITPSKTEQTAVYPQRYTKGAITVAPIPDKYQDVSEVTASAGAVMEGEKFVDKNGNVIEGTMPIYSGDEVVLDTTNTHHVVNEGYYEDYHISIVPEEKTVTPTDTQQIITPSAGCVLSKVTVEAAESGGGGGNTDTCTVTITMSSGYAVELYGALVYRDGVYSLEYPGRFDISLPVTINNVVCNSLLHISFAAGEPRANISGNCQCLKVYMYNMYFLVSANPNEVISIELYDND